MTADSIMLADITEIFQDVLGDDTLAPTPDFSRTDNAQWDSMNHLNIMFALEAKYGIKFGVVDVEAIRSVADIIRLVKQKTGK